jgi:TolB-like protein/Tfp pilus assembly protein PilF
MFTDMVGYTALGQRNESISLALVDEQRKLVRPILSRHRGKEVKTTGDGFIVEFRSALDAVRCAYDIQRAARELNFSLPQDRKVLLRIGVHLGDVVESGGDISGDAVNVASRIDSLAEEGGVCITRQVYDHVQNKTELSLRSLGAKSLKNVTSPVEVYKIVMPWSERDAVHTTTLDKKRIAVLPLANISPSPNDEYFADGLTDELIATVSQLPGLQVIARTSVMAYKGASKTVSEVGRELEVGSVLEGSVRKVANRIRVTTQLIETETQAHIWASTYDRELDDIFAIQSDIANRVAEALKITLLSNDKERLDKVPTRNREAYILYLKGRNSVGERSLQGFKRGMEYFEEAVRRDPNYAHAYTGMSDCYHLLENWGFIHPMVAWPKSKEYAARAIALDDSLAEAHTSMAMALAIMDWDWRAAEEEYKRALALNPSYVTAHHWYATHFLVAQRRLEEAVKEMQEAHRLDPFSPVIATNLGRALFLSGRREEAKRHYSLALELNPNFAYAHVQLGMALLSESSNEEGSREIDAAVRASPDFFEAQAALATVYARSGKTDDAKRILQGLQSRSGAEYVPATWIGVVCGALGELDQAFEWLEKAANDHSSTFPEYYTEPMFDSLKDDPRFGRLLGEIGLR